jgi:hypothetical protein
MAKSTSKPSDRGRNSPEPGPTPGTRAEQRDTTPQMTSGQPSDDPALEWERSEQEKLPPRGTGNIHNQGEDHEATIVEAHGMNRDSMDAGGENLDLAGTHTGGTRGPSNDNRGTTPPPADPPRKM